MAGTNQALRDQLSDSAVTPVPVTTTTTDVTPVTKAALLCGYAFAETTAAAVAYIQIVGAGSGGVPVVIPIRLASGASDHESFMDEGILMESGITIHVVSGSVIGSILVRV